MEFKQEELVEREIEIAGYLLQGYSSKLIAEKMRLRKKIVTAHIHNMMEKLRAEDEHALMNRLKAMRL